MDSLNDHQRSVYLQFIEVTSCNVPENDEEEQKLIKFLSFYDWILESCIHNFFEKDGSLDVPDRVDSVQPPPIQPRPIFANNNINNNNNNNNNTNSPIPSTSNPMLNEFLTRMKFPQAILINDDVISENMTKLLVQRNNIDKALIKYGYKRNNNELITNLGRFSNSIKNSNSIFFFIWPIISVLDLFWKGISYFLGLQFLFGGSSKNNNSNDGTERKVIVPIPYFKFTDQLDLIEMDTDDNIDGLEEEILYEKQNEKEPDLLDLYDIDNFHDPTFKQILQVCQPELIPRLSHINMGKTSEVQYDCKIKSKFLFFIILNDSFNKLSTKVSLPSQKSSFILNKILPSEDIANFLKEKDQVEIHLGDVAYQIAPWVQQRSVQGLQAPPNVVIMAKVDGLLSLLGKVNLTNISKPSQLIKKINSFIDRFDVSLGLSLQRYELLELEYSRKIKDMQDQEFEKTLRVDAAKQAKKDLINMKHLQYMQFAVNELLLKQYTDISDSNLKPCQLQIKVLDGSRLILKINPEEYTVAKLYNLLEVLQYLGINNNMNEQIIRTMLTDKVEECILNKDLQIFKTGEEEEEIEELDELEIETIINNELSKWDNKLNSFNSFIELDEENEAFPQTFNIVSPFPRKVIPITDTLLKDDKELYPRANLIIELVDKDDDNEDEEE